MTKLIKKIAALLIGSLVVVSAHAQAATVVTYYHTNALGSPVAATDEYGNKLWNERYQPYGKRIDNDLDSSDNRIWYTGKPADELTGLSYYGARYYDPLIGRFYSTDPIGFRESSTQSFNKYCYAGNNPTSNIDIDGMYEHPAYMQAFFPGVYYVDQGSVAWDNKQYGTAALFMLGAVADDVMFVFTLGESQVARATAFTAARTATRSEIRSATVIAVKSGAQYAIKEGIYEFVDTSGKIYIGQSSNIAERLTAHINTGKLAEGQAVKTTEVLGGKTAREVAEFKRIREATEGVPARFSDKVSNQRDPIGPNRSYLLNE